MKRADWIALAERVESATGPDRAMPIRQRLLAAFKAQKKETA